MSEAKQRCGLHECNRAASARCFCCEKNVCTRHFTAHLDVIKSQIDPLAKESNTMVEQIQGLTIEQLIETPLAELNKWKIDMHQLVDAIFFEKMKKIEDLIKMNKNKFVQHKQKQSENIMKIQEDVKQLVEEGDATSEQIQLLKSHLVKIESDLTSFRNNFLSVTAIVFAQGLVIVSSNLTKPRINLTQSIVNWPQLLTPDSITPPIDSSSEYKRSPIKAKRSSEKPAQQLTGSFPFSSFGSQMQAPSTNSNCVKGNFPTIPPSPFSAQRESSAPCVNNTSLFGGQ